jgi:hypothetical protein
MGWAGPVHPCDVNRPALSATLFVFMEDGFAWTSHHRSPHQVDFFDSFQKKKIDLFDLDEVNRRRRKWC